MSPSVPGRRFASQPAAACGNAVRLLYFNFAPCAGITLGPTAGLWRGVHVHYSPRIRITKSPFFGGCPGGRNRIREPVAASHPASCGGLGRDGEQHIGGDSNPGTLSVTMAAPC